MEANSKEQSPASRSNGRPGVIALERGLRILSAFDRRTPVLTLAGLAVRTGLNKSTILRLLYSLESLGFIDRDKEGLYRIGAQAWRVGMLFNGELRLQQLLPPILNELSNSVDESVSFWIPLETTSPPSRLCVCRAEPPRSIRVRWVVGSTVPLDSGGSTSRMMRAFVDPTHREDDRIRAEGVCTTWTERDPELCGASSPVFGFDGELVGVLTISAPISRRSRKWLESMKPVALSAAEKIMQSLNKQLSLAQ